jgi:uncharacterized protein (TIGR00730 family)
MADGGIVTVFGSSRAAPGDVLYQDARRLGRLLAEGGYAVCTGGYAGVMEAVSLGATEVGGTAIGVTVASWSARVRPNPWLTREVTTAHLFDRLARLIASDVYVALPGGPGTLGEVAIAWNLFQTQSIPVRPLILVGPEWRRGLARLAEDFRITPSDLALLQTVESIDEVLPAIRAGRAH